MAEVRGADASVRGAARVKLDAGLKPTHGFLGDPHWSWPVRVRSSEEVAREGYGSGTLAHEYLDEPEVLDAKVKVLANLMRRSVACIVYTGAGISTASGISDYASKATSSLANAGRARLKKVMPMDAQPTLTHRALAKLHADGYVKHWVQQNHDGLPQKAGFPQEHLNEIHGSLFDPSNPVVPMGGSLRHDLHSMMSDWEKRTDLCLALGTSMVGMAADCVATTVGRKAKASRRKKKAKKGEADALGLVIVTLQQTRRDEDSALRIFAPVDQVMELLARELETLIPRALHYAATKPEADGEEHIYEGLPYLADGHFSSSATMSLDLRVGSKVKIVGQSEDDCTRWGDVGEVVESLGGMRDEGHYCIRLGDTNTGILRVLGRWWVDDAKNGAVSMLPVVPLST